MADTDLILALFIYRNGVTEDAFNFFKMVKNSRIKGCVTDLCLDKISYFSNKWEPQKTDEIISKIREDFEIIDIKWDYIQRVDKFSNYDTEFASEIVCASEESGVDFIITHQYRNNRDLNPYILSVNELAKYLLEDNFSASLIKSFRNINKIALLIGVSEYENYQPLAASPKDIEAMEKMLKNPRLGGFNRVEKLLDTDAEGITTKIKDFLTSAQKDDLVFLYFSGHGDIDNDHNLHLIARNSHKENKTKTIENAIAASAINEMMTNCKCRQQVLILDACYSGAIQGCLSSKGAIAEQVEQKSNDIQDSLRKLQAEGRCILTSSNMNEESFEDQNTGLSIFTHCLLEVINSGEADLNDDGLITMGEIYQSIVPKIAAKMQQLNENMTPQIIAMDQGLEISLSQTNYLPEIYHSLEKLLKEGNWKDADQETLAIFKKINRKNNKNFPNEDIDIIDQLWLKHSKNRFGFTIQRRIWRNLKPCKTNIEKWQEFGKCLGWYHNKDWLEYDDFDFTLDAPEGHFPSLRESSPQTGWLQGWKKRVKGFLFPEETSS
ncbi:MAG: hypothetical protein F6K47_20855 [Symploca sp. SIO2E6]|nr:hypothetical protein [Symploca sp. SIO2E6]